MGPERGLHKYPSSPEGVDNLDVAPVDMTSPFESSVDVFEVSFVEAGDSEGFLGAEVADYEDPRLEKAYTLNFPEGYSEAEFCAARDAYSEEDFHNIDKALVKEPIDPAYIERVKSVIEIFKAAIDEVHELFGRADRVRQEYKRFEFETSRVAIHDACASMIMAKVRGRYNENDSYTAHLERVTDNLARDIGEMRQIEQELLSPLKTVQDKKRILDDLKTRAEFILSEGQSGRYVQLPEIPYQELEVLAPPDADDYGDWRERLALEQSNLVSRNGSNLGKGK